MRQNYFIWRTARELWESFQLKSRMTRFVFWKHPSGHNIENGLKWGVRVGQLRGCCHKQSIWEMMVTWSKQPGKDVVRLWWWRLQRLTEILKAPSQRMKMLKCLERAWGYPQVPSRVWVGSLPPLSHGLLNKNNPSLYPVHTFIKTPIKTPCKFFLSPSLYPPSKWVLSKRNRMGATNASTYLSLNFLGATF